MDKAWVGIDARKEFHRAHTCWTLRGGSGSPVRPKTTRRTSLQAHRRGSLFGGKSRLGGRPAGGCGATLLLALRERHQSIVYVPGFAVGPARDTCRGESKTDARDAHVSADQARMRPDLG